MKNNSFCRVARSVFRRLSQSAATLDREYNDLRALPRGIDILRDKRFWKIMAIGSSVFIPANYAVVGALNYLDSPSFQRNLSSTTHDLGCAASLLSIVPIRNPDGSIVSTQQLVGICGSPSKPVP